MEEMNNKEELRKRIEQVTAEDYETPPEMKKKDYLLAAALAAFCLAGLLAGIFFV